MLPEDSTATTTPTPASPESATGARPMLRKGVEATSALLGSAVPTRWGLNLFWRTFIMIAVMLLVSTIGWLVTIRTANMEPRAMQTAQQIASLVNLSRTALIYSDAITRFSLIRELAEEESVRILLREPDDAILPMASTPFNDQVARELQYRLGPDTVLASQVNGEKGLWIGFDIDSDAYWLLTDESRITSLGGTTWLIWLLMAAGLSLLGAAVIAGLVNRPLKQLSVAIGKVRLGNYTDAHLDEEVPARELREVNIGFNRMVEQLSAVEQERVVMLAGISHDLRTPLARLRLEVEMSVDDEESRKYMAADIEQVDGIITKFMDYARPDGRELAAVALADVVRTSAYPYQNQDEMVLDIDVPENLKVKADEIELARVISNLLENARRYGKTPGKELTEVSMKARAEGNFVHLEFADQGNGVPPDMLDRLTQPFYRADEARTSAVGSGLGLAIVKKVVEHMGGSLQLSNGKNGGLRADLRMPKAK